MFIGLGSNDVCPSFGHNYSGDRVDFFVYDADGGDGRSPGWVRLDRFRGPGRDVGVHNGKYYNLTPTEIQIANLIKQGKSSKDIAGQFKMSPDFDEPLEDFKEYME